MGRRGGGGRGFRLFWTRKKIWHLHYCAPTYLASSMTGCKVMSEAKGTDFWTAKKGSPCQRQVISQREKHQWYVHILGKASFLTKFAFCLCLESSRGLLDCIKCSCIASDVQTSSFVRIVYIWKWYGEFTMNLRCYIPTLRTANHNLPIINCPSTEANIEFYDDCHILFESTNMNELLRLGRNVIDFKACTNYLNQWRIIC